MWRIQRKVLSTLQRSDVAETSTLRLWFQANPLYPQGEMTAVRGVIGIEL